MDPAFYERFSKLLEDTIEEYRQKRKSESDYLESVVEVALAVMDIVHERHIVDVWSNETAQNRDRLCDRARPRAQDDGPTGAGLPRWGRFGPPSLARSRSCVPSPNQ